MSYREIYKEQNEQVQERYELAMERIAEIPAEVLKRKDAFAEYFRVTADFILLCEKTLELALDGNGDGLDKRSLEECEQWNEKLYSEITGEHYEKSYVNPDHAVEKLGENYGKCLSFLFSELHALISFSFEGRKREFTIFAELYLQIYGLFGEDELPETKEIEDAVYWFYHDYSEIFSEDAVQKMVDPSLDFFTGIVMESDLSDLRYLYRYGACISDNERKLAEYLNSMPEEEIQAMADTYTEGYRIGFEVTGKDLSKKKTVSVEYAIGFERMVRAAIRNFGKMGLKPVISREAVFSFQGLGNRKRGCYVKSLNKQYEYDHKNDRAFYVDKAFTERRLETLNLAFEAYKELAAELAGPAVIETFGEQSFDPVNKKNASVYTDRQNSLNVQYAAEAGQITNRYIKGEERSFTIIAYPVPEIGKDFRQIFKETVKLNTLDYVFYRDMQQKIIDVLNTGVSVHITGKNGNRTDLMVSLYPLEDPEKETIFENCVADVNIPVGEVFTSPVLKGTTGLLNVSRVYLEGLQYTDLVITFEDGMIRDYTCSNFKNEDENRKYIYENVLMQHETLPIGEFAIGTNTTAYKMARVFGIEDKMPILIAEKTGPHFAVGDTCYSHEEDTAVYNPDGKKIVAKDNEVSLQRKTDPSKAYLNCHTDITIPYDELEAITVIRADGTTEDIIRDGRFVVAGTEALNKPLEELEKQHK